MRFDQLSEEQYKAVFDKDRRSDGDNSGAEGSFRNVARTGLKITGPISIVAILFVVASLLTWYFTWFGRELSPAEISKYLADEQRPRHVQHALAQIQQRMDRRDPAAKDWYPQILALASHPETEFRLTVAWLMGFDPESDDFHQALLKLVRDPEPIVRRNAALALVRFKDSTGRGELLSILRPFGVNATAAGTVASTLREKSIVSRASLLARIAQPDGRMVEVRSPLNGSVELVSAKDGSSVALGDPIIQMRADEESVWEALRGLDLIGEAEDLSAVESYASGRDYISERVKKQASLTLEAIQSRIRGVAN